MSSPDKEVIYFLKTKLGQIENEIKQKSTNLNNLKNSKQAKIFSPKKKEKQNIKNQNNQINKNLENEKITSIKRPNRNKDFSLPKIQRKDKSSDLILINDVPLQKLMREVDLIKKENQNLNEKIEENANKSKIELEKKQKEINSMIFIKEDYTKLTHKFEDLIKMVEVECIDEGEKLKNKIKDQEKLIINGLNEKDILKQNLKSLKIKVKYQIMENKKNLQNNEKIIKKDESIQCDPVINNSDNETNPKVT